MRAERRADRHWRLVRAQEEAVQVLSRILRAYSVHDPEVGYTQVAQRAVCLCFRGCGIPLLRARGRRA